MESIPRKNQMPLIGLGTYKADNDVVLVNAVKAAVQAGYRHFDCAYIYFNEKHVGQGIREAIAESNGALKREDFFITSKLWNTYHSKERVQKCLDHILECLGFDYLDLFLMHWSMGHKEDAEDYPVGPDGKLIPSDIHYVETYKAMEDLMEGGKVKNIGVSNFNIEQLKEILSIARVKPFCNQFEVHPLLPNYELVEFCQSQGLITVAYAPLGAPDRSWLKPEDPVPLQHPLVVGLAEKYKKSPAQIVLRWLIQRQIVVIPKSVTPSRIQENAQIFDFALSDEDIKVFETFKDSKVRFYHFDMCDNHPLYPFH